MNIFKSNKGFSLIELMVVVAIIGILASIAVPNFQRFQRTTRQKEAQTILSGIWKAQKAFFQQYNQYTSDLGGAGYVPEGAMMYNAGFDAAGDDPATPRNWFNPTPLNNANFSTAIICGAAGNRCSTGFAVDALPNTTAAISGGTGDNSAFVLGAAGDIGGLVPDHWTLDQNKTFVNPQSGL